MKPVEAAAASSAAAAPWISAHISQASRCWPSRLSGALACSAATRARLLDGHERELQQVALDVGVGQVHEVLVERVGRRARGIEPERAVGALAELLAVGARDQRHREAVHGRAGAPAHELDARGDVAPLIRAARLQLAVQVLVQPGGSRWPAAACS